jgi:hypothetical protein
VKRVELNAVDYDDGCMSRLALPASIATLLAVSAVLRAAEPAIEFNCDIRPVLAENCLACHGQDAGKRQADLRLDVREQAVRAEAVVPGDAAKSKLVQRIHSANPEEVMPPPDSNRRLTAAQKSLLERWIAAGAVYQEHWA